MGKSSDMSEHYRPGTSRRRGTAATFREQMTDFARGDRLLELREQRRMSRESVAHEIGVTTKSLYEWEKRSGPIKFVNAEKLAAFYDLDDPEQLVTRDPTVTGPSSRGQVGDIREEFRGYVTELKDLMHAAAIERREIQALLDEQTALLAELREAVKVLGAAQRVLVMLEEAAGRLPALPPGTEDAGGPWRGADRRHGERRHDEPERTG